MKEVWMNAVGFARSVASKEIELVMIVSVTCILVFKIKLRMAEWYDWNDENLVEMKGELSESDCIQRMDVISPKVDEEG